MSEINLIEELRHQLKEANKVLSNKLIKSINNKWPEHNKPESNICNIYELINKNEIEDALNVLTTSDPNLVSGEFFYLKGICYLRLKNFEKAIENFEKAIEYYFTTPFVLFNNAEANKALGRNKDALSLYKSALELFPAFAECRHNYALLLNSSGFLLQAELQFRLNLIYKSDYFKNFLCSKKNK